ncbi:RskA family anti-sigma factor, partial [Nocardia cyriacigeorgica]|uniref:RskA family anti-sigma factor n=1 Tax=Nocardia cyriacigeorgica TaxID=135487 RepID=UPI003CC800D9
MTDAPSPEHPDDHDLLDLAHLYALDAVSDTERASIEHRLRVCDPDIRRAFDDIVRETREAMGALSILDAKAPPQQLEAKILAAIAERAAAGPAEVSDGNRLGTPAGTEPHEGAGDDGGTDELAAAGRRRRQVMGWVAPPAPGCAGLAIRAARGGAPPAGRCPSWAAPSAPRAATAAGAATNRITLRRRSRAAASSSVPPS